MIVDGIRYWWGYGVENKLTVCRAITAGVKTDGIDPQTLPLLAAAGAVCGERDLYDKDVGRRVSLGRVLQKLYPLPEKGPHMTAADMALWVHNKVMRFNAWEVYRTLPDKPRWGVAKVPKTT